MKRPGQKACEQDGENALSVAKRKSILLDEAEKIARMGTWDWNIKNNEVCWSAVFFDIVQLDPKETEPSLAAYLALLGEEDRTSLYNAVIGCIKTHQVFEHHHRLILPDGNVRHIESRGNTLFDEAGRPHRMIGTIHDVTERIEAQLKQEMFFRLVNTSINEIYIIDCQSYRFTFASEGACRNLGYTQQELTQLTPFDLCPVLPKVQVIEMMAPVVKRQQELAIFECVHARKDGSTYPVEVHLQMMDKGGPAMIVAVVLDISAKKQAQQKLNDQAVLLRSVIDATRDLIFFKDSQGHYLGCNKAFEKLTGFDEHELIGQSDFAIFEGARAKQFEQGDNNVISQGAIERYQLWTSYCDGNRVLLDTTKTPYYNQSGEIAGVVGVCSDATDSWHFEKNLKTQARFLQSIIDHINESIIVVNHALEVQLINKTAKRYIDQGIMVEPRLRKGQRDMEGQLLPCPLCEVLEQRVNKTVIHNHTSGDGIIRHIELMISPLLDEEGHVIAAIEIGRDITNHLKLQHQLELQKNAFEYNAHYDALTCLPNRVLFHDRLSQAMAKAKRNRELLALFFVDLDHFKTINDTYGHDIGDRVLQQAANRIKCSVREMDSVARLGGDEFTVILENIRQVQSATIIAQKIVDSMRPPIVIDGRSFTVTTSIGIALYPDNGDSIEALMKHADEAMYLVKQESRDGMQFYSENLSDEAFERALMEDHLRQALQNNELKICYQATYELSNGQMIGIEALSRWSSPQLGTVMPEQFIPLAEDVGLIQSIDEWVLEKACLQMVQWKAQGLGDIRLSVNLSSVELNRKNLIDVVSNILDSTGCEPQWLEIEITESGFIGNHQQAHRMLDGLKALGVGLVIDDFGTGYSSLKKLKELPISKLKIDHSFISNVTGSDNDAEIARAVIALAKSLGLKVVAEGVETEQQRELLIALHCEQAQGYLFSYPVSADLMAQELALS